MNILDDIGVGDILQDVAFAEDMIGTTCVISMAMGDYDAVSDSITDQDDFSESISCSVPLAYSAKEIDDTRIKSGDLKLIITGSAWSDLPEGSPAEPTTDMQVTFGGIDYSIVDPVEKMHSGSAVIMYTLQLRK